MIALLNVLKELADVWFTLGIGFLLGLACLFGAYMLPLLRQTFLGLAVACFAATLTFGWGVKQERDVSKAQQARAELMRQERDKLQTRLASEDEARRVAGLEEANRKEEESDDEYAKRLAAKGPIGACALTDDDLR